MDEENKDIRTVLITGGTRGIGRAVAIRLAGHGFSKVLANYCQDDASAAETKANLERLGATCHLYRANLAFPAEIEGMFDRLNEVCSRIDAFVHCAALGAFKPLSEVKPNQWDLSMAINARAFLHCIQKCRPLMKDGSVVAISSLGSRMALPNYGAIGPSKAAMEAVVRQLAMELGPHGIRINAVAAGVIENQARSVFPHFDDLKTLIIKNTPAGRIGTPEDVADIVAFLVSRDARWIQGQVIVADGGFSLGISGNQ